MRFDVSIKPQSKFYGLVILVLRAAMVLALFSAGWLVYRNLPGAVIAGIEEPAGATNLQLVMRPAPNLRGVALDIPVKLYPVDIVAVRHEYFTERRTGKPFDDFMTERMNGRTPVTARLDQQGQATVAISPGNWWVHAVLSGEEDLEWRLPISVSGAKQSIELTTQNAYGRTKSF